MPAKHTPRGDASFRNSLLRAGGGAVGLVALVALVFGLIGGIGPSADGPLVADDRDQDGEPTRDAVPDEGSDPDEDADPDAPDTADDDVEPEAQPDEQEPAADEPEEEPREDESDESDEPDEPEEPDEQQPEPDDEEATDGADREFAPDSITVQVLDGYQDDGGSAAAAVAETLRGQGYRVVAENPSLRYEVTTVLFTPGFEAQARQVATELGASEVRQQPGNLSEQVQVHVVVGADRG